VVLIGFGAVPLVIATVKSYVNLRMRPQDNHPHSASPA
jgi:hypothetical protein